LEHFIDVRGATRNNLKAADARIPLGAMTTVTGPSGAGKTSLVLGTLFPNVAAFLTGGAHSRKPHHCASIAGIDNISEVVVIDRGPVAKSSVSMPATYLDVFGDLRELFAGLPESQMRGLTVKSFSLHSEGGRCEECRGRGEVNLVMKFLSDARVPCSICHGRRYRPHMLDIRFNALSMDQVLELTIDEALLHFKNHRKIQRKLQPAVDLGLGYLKLGQPSASLSGGESQRLKMVPYLVKQRNSGSLILVDEPTTGLHAEDIQRLVIILQRLVSQGATVVVIEHNADVICASDWVVDVGPGAANDGGSIVYQGPLAGLMREKRSITGRYLGPLLH
jgi:excinuclease ABC subunit A